MNLSSFHVHTTFCDGKNSPEEMVRAAIEAGMSAIGFSAHAAWPFASEWHLQPTRYGEYLAEIARLKIEYGSRITILCGFEADWIPGITAPDPAVYAPFAPDYLIGSVHYVVPQIQKGRNPTPCAPWSVDASAEEVALGIETCFENDGKKAVCTYWSAVREMVASCTFDIVGHLDVIRKRNGILRFFDETARWYRGELEETAKTIARSGKIAEINTGGIARKAIEGVYPSDELLALLYKHDVPVMINSDAHATADLVCAYDRALDAARKAGYTEVSSWGTSGWISEKI